MNDNLKEKTDPSVTAEETVPEDIEEITGDATEAESIETQTAETAVQETQESQDDQASEEKQGSDESDMTVGSEGSAQASEEKPEKKKSFLKISVIVALCLVIAALLGYFAYKGFILKEPEDVIWTDKVDGMTYYYEFKKDGTFHANMGSVEFNSTFHKTKGDNGNTITVDENIGSFHANVPFTYTISGSRLSGNQTLNGSYGDGDNFTLNQTSEKPALPELPKEFTPVEAVVGTWVFKGIGDDGIKLTLDNKGYMSMEYIQNGIKHNGVYTVDDSTINFTYRINEDITIPLKYTLVDSDNMIVMDINFERE